MNSSPSSFCPDCGNAQLNHRIEKLEIIGNWLAGKITLPFSSFRHNVESAVGGAFDRIAPFFLRALLRCRLATIADSPDAGTDSRSRVFWEEAKKRGIRMRECRIFGISRGTFIASWKEETIVFHQLPRIGALSPSLQWMDNKGVMRERFAAAGIPVAKGGVARTWKEAERIFETLTPPFITKPNLGSRSRHTTIHIRTLEELRIGFEKAKQLSPWVIMEEELDGLVHRGTVIGGKLAAVLRREPASVIGDGTHSILELIALANQNPLRAGPIFHKLDPENHEYQTELLRQGLSFSSIPAAGDMVLLAQKSSRGMGGGATDFTDDIHPDNIALLERVANILADPLVGIDFIIKDVSTSWKNQPRTGVIECNSMPFIDLHMYPLVGKPRNTAGALWDIVFPNSGAKSGKY